MNLRDEQEPLSFSELAAGSAAVAAVALIAFLGVRVSQSSNPPPADISLAPPTPGAAPGSSAEASQQRRNVPTATARAPQGQPQNEAIRRVAESSGPDSARGNPPAANAVATKGSSASSFLVEAAPATAVEMQSPDIGGPTPPLIGLPDLFRPNTTSGRPPNATREAAIPAPAEAGRNPSNPSDAIWIQTKLHDLGYYAGNGNGVWGLASRNALRDFKTMNGLPEDDKWDRDTEQRLVSKQSVPASSTFIGGWAQSVEECQRFRGVGAPLIIASRGAETDNVKCSFRSIKQELATMWRIAATCSAGGQSWHANVSLKLNGSSLNWSSENGKETYVRCSKPDKTALRPQ